MIIATTQNNTCIDLLNWFSKNIFCRPAKFNSRMQSKLAQPYNLRPLCNTFAFPTKGKCVVVPSISLLDFLGRPPTVFFRVISMTVYSVYGCISLPYKILVFNIRLVHIVSKLFKGRPKTFYSPTSICFIFSIRASILYFFPNFVKTSFTCSMFFILRKIFDITTTTSCLPTSDTLPKTNFFFSTFASKQPIIRTPFLLHIFYRRQATKFLSSYVYFFHKVFTKKGYPLSRRYPSLVLSY